MADEAQKEELQKPKSKVPIKTFIILLLVFLLEGGAISFFFIMKGGPKPAEGTNPIDETVENESEHYAEILLAEGFQVDNYKLGRSRMVVTLEVAAKVDSADREKLALAVEEHRKEILSTIRELVSDAQPDQLKDPKLEVIKRETRTAVEEIVSGEGLIKEILFPVWQTFVAD